MGNEQSASGNANPAAGVSSSLSFLAGKSNSVKKPSPIVVVNASGQVVGNPKDDEDLKRLREIPRFQPILKSVLSGQRDPAGVFNKVDDVSVVRFFGRVVQHIVSNKKAVSAHHEQLSHSMTDAEQRAMALLRRLSVCGEKFKSTVVDLKRVKVLLDMLPGLEQQLEDLFTGLQCLNEVLPEADRLPEFRKIPPGGLPDTKF